MSLVTYKNRMLSMIDKWQPKNIKELVLYWLMFYASPRKAASSVVRDKYTLKKYILPAFGDEKITGISGRAVEFWYLGLVQQGKISTKTCNDNLGLFKKILNDAVRWGFIAQNPILMVKRMSLPEKDMDFWSQGEVKQFLGYWGSKEQLPNFFWSVIVALYTGMRKGEVLGLKWSAVSFEAGFITVKQIYCREAKKMLQRTKSKKIRRIPINSTLKRYLLKLREITLSSEYVVFQRHPDSFRKVFRKMSQEAGVKEIRYHDLRHTFASIFLMSGGNIYDLQRILGHSSVQVTERYTHFLPDHLKGKTEILGY